MLEITLVGGPTAVLGYGDLRWLTDPAFSPPGEYAGGLVKTTGPALEPAAIEPIDVVLLSHDQHSDNLDPAGREFLSCAGRVLTTVAGAKRVGGSSTSGLEPWDTVEVQRPSGGTVTVTAVPAQHGPDGSESIMGPVIGFVLTGPGLERVYISGDNASLDLVRTIAGRVGPVDVAVLFAGAVQVAYRFDHAYLTLSSDFAAEATKILAAKVAFPVHFEGWTHFTQGEETLRSAFAGCGVTDRLALPGRGKTITIDPESWSS
ncbi:MAG TPA: MBL fold metallo-hydrolase [Gaiellaceae bacterium]|nr:MBL fold metallo-hydrolase [Gaiellaceae bacterium]